MGKNGNWKDLGYIIFHEKKNDILIIKANSSNGELVAEVHFKKIEGCPNEIIVIATDASEPWVELNHRRLGLMTAMYERAEKVSESTVVESSWLSSEGENFWSQKNRPFGNS